MRRRAAVDANQPAIVAALRKCGVWVGHLHQLGHGWPDTLCWSRPRGFRLIEIKDGSLPKSRQVLTPDEVRFHLECPGPIDVVCSPEEALAIMLRP